MLSHIKILNFAVYADIGIIATIQFLHGSIPTVGETIRYNNEDFKITGIVVSASSKIINDNLSQDIFDCRLEKLKNNT